MAKKKSKKKGAKKKEDKKKLLKLKLRKKKDSKKKGSKKKDSKKKDSKKKGGKKKDSKKKDKKKNPQANPAVVEAVEASPAPPVEEAAVEAENNQVDHSSNYNVLEAVRKLKSIKKIEELLAFTHGEKRLTVTKAIPPARKKLEG